MSPPDPEWPALDASGQACLVRRGEVSPRELAAAACLRIERLDGLLGAVAVRYFDLALAAADRVDRAAPFAGVPFLMKDVGARQAGLPYYAGNRALREADFRAPEDTVLGARFRELGLVSLGNSNAPEFGLQSNTWPLTNGPTRNPWDPSRAAGGSSGGACAAVAAGMVAVAHASDGAGSIRIPASWCGLIGLKPSRDRVLWRHAGKGLPELEFVVARSLRDTAAFLDELRPPADREVEPGRFREAARGNAAPARIGFTIRCPGGSKVHTDCVRAVHEAALALADRGHAVEEAAPSTLADYAERALYGTLLGPAGYRGVLDELAERLGRQVTEHDVEPFLWTLANLATDAASPAELAQARRWNRAWVERCLAWFDDFDLLVTPTVCEPAPLLTELDPTRHTPLDLLEKMVPHMAFTEPWNATGQPAITLPLAWSKCELPVGVQLVANLDREDLLLAVAADLLEELSPELRAPPMAPRTGEIR